MQEIEEHESLRNVKILDQKENKKFLAKKIRLLKSQNPEFGIKRIWDQLREVDPTLKFSKVKNRVKNLGLVIKSPGFRSQPARFQCGTCAKSYTRKNGLVRHQRTHTGDTPFECAECGKPFSLKTSLLEHMRVHSGEKPFKCLTCARAFKNRSGWRRHMSTHSLEKKYVCPIEGCGQKFCRQFSLTQHLRSLQHNGTEIYVCSLCYKVLSSSIKLKHHMWVHRPRPQPVFSSSSCTPAGSFSSTDTDTAVSTTSSCLSSSHSSTITIPSNISSRIFSGSSALSSFSCSRSCRPRSQIRFAPISHHNRILSSFSSIDYSHVSNKLPSLFAFQLFDEDDFCLEDEEFNSREDDLDLFSSECEEREREDLLQLDEKSDKKIASQFACDVEGCGKTFAYRHVLRKHSSSHSTEVSFLCSLCPRGFKSQAALNYHEQYQHNLVEGEIERREERGSKHTLRFLICGGGSMWKCQLCQQSFKRKFDLQCHYISCQHSPTREDSNQNCC